MCREELALFEGGALKEYDKAVFALREAKKATSNAKFIARRHTQYAPKAGDLIACERRSLDDATFDTYIDFVVAGRFEGHCDFVVGFNEAKTKIITIGGNLGNSVKEKSWPLNSKGRVGDRDPTSSVAGVVCIIECRL